MKKVFVTMVMVILVATQAMAGGRIAGYHDPVRDQEMLSFEGWTALPHNFGLYGFVDITTNRGDSDLENQADLTDFYGEFNIHYKINDLRIMAEFDDGTGMPMLFCPGIQYWVPTDKLQLAIKLLPYRVNLVENNDEANGLIGVFWRIDFLDKKMFFEGMIDITYTYENQTDYFPLIIEPQLGLNLSKNTALVVEYTYNNFALEDDHGLRLGGEFRF